jgi:hypothetical protein
MMITANKQQEEVSIQVSTTKASTMAKTTEAIDSNFSLKIMQNVQL